MDRREHLRREIDRAEVELVAKVQELEWRAEEMKQRVADTFDLEHQVQTRPWRAVGAAMAAGLVLGWLFS